MVYLDGASEGRRARGPSSAAQHLKLLIDTNVFIDLEDDREVAPRRAEMLRRCAEAGIKVFVHAATTTDVQRDRVDRRRAVSLSKLDKFPAIRAREILDWAALERVFGPIRKANDRVDVQLLDCLNLNVVDLLVTEDQGIHNRVQNSPLRERVLTVDELIDWLKGTFGASPVDLPLVAERRAYEIDGAQPFFDSLRGDYDGFDDWWARCVRDHRWCWTVTISQKLAALIVRKDEGRSEAGIEGPGEKVLKLCTFKVAEEFRGEKIGELLLKQALWFASKNNYDAVYLTAYPKQNSLLRLLEYYGFERTRVNEQGEYWYEKSMLPAPKSVGSRAELLPTSRKHYPSFVSGPPADAFCVPVQGKYHHRLFPEIATAELLPLFPELGRVVPTRGSVKPGNTIKKVYLCKSNNRQARVGDVLLFYKSKTLGMSLSQALTSVGVLESTFEAATWEELARATAKRSVFSDAELSSMLSEGAVYGVNFLLVGHLEPCIPLDELKALGLVRSPPQSIARVPRDAFQALRCKMRLSFEAP